MPNWASHAHFSPFSNGSCQIGPLMPTLAYFQMDHAKLGLSCPLWPIKVDFGFIQRIYYLFDSSWEFLYTSISLSPVDKWNQANNPKKRNSPLNTCAEDMRVKISFEELVCYALCVNRVYMFSFFIKVSLHFMHTCIYCNFFQKKRWWNLLKGIFLSHKLLHYSKASRR